MSLSFVTEADGFYHPPPIDYPPGVPRLDTPDRTGKANPALVIPSHGFSANRCPDGSEKIYVFFSSFSDDTTRHPLRSLLEYSCDRGQTFHYLYEVSAQHFINGSSVIVDSATIPGLPQPSGRGLLVWGSGEYRQSDVYLAFVPLGRVEDRASWRYFRAPSSPGQPAWVQEESLATPVLTTTRSPQTPSPCVGELSVTWNPVLRKWLALYNCNGLSGPSEIRFQVADRPWGPWSEFIESGPGGLTTVLFQPERDVAYGHIVDGLVHGFMHRALFQDGLDDTMFGEGRFDRWGDPYGPYVISRYTMGDARSTTIYYTMSTWNPYQVMLMRSTLRLERPPVANAEPEQTVSADQDCQAQVMLDGKASTDPDGDPLTYTWTGPFGTVTGATPTVTVPLGTSTITLTVDDGLGESASDEVEIVVRDTTHRARASMLCAGASERR